MKKTKTIDLPLTAKSGGLAFSGMIFLYFLITFIGQSVFQAIGISSGIVFFVVSSLFSILSILCVLLFSHIMYKRSFVQLTGIGKFSPKYLSFAILLAVGMFFGLGFINQLFTSALEKMGAVFSTRDLPLDNFWQFLLVVFLVCVLPAMLEEIFFRGFMMNCLDGIKVWQKALFVSLCFSLYHCSFAQLVYQFIYGVFLCLLAVDAKSTYPCVIAHFINNFTVVLFTYLEENVDLFNPITIVCGILLLVLVAFLIVRNLKKTPKKEEDKEEIENEKLDFWLPYGILGGVVCLVVMISNLVLAV